MSNLSNEFIAQAFAQESDDPFLALLTLSHSSFGTINMVNNSEDIVSNGVTFEPFPFSLVLPSDDGESIKDVQLSLDNASLELIDELRSIRDFIGVNIKLVLASNPDLVEVEISQLQIISVEYSGTKITATLILDNFLNTELTSEKYTPTFYPGLFT